MQRMTRAGALAAVCALWSGPTLAHAQDAEYDELTNTYGSVTNFNVETTRGMTITDTGRLLAINTHGSELVEIDTTSWTRSSRVPTLNNPVAVDHFEAGSTEYAVVLGGGTHGLALHELPSGRVVRTLSFSAEPGDLVVDRENDTCFVSLPGNNTVLQVRLPDLSLEVVYEVPSQRPRYLFLDHGDVATSGDSVVYVTPELSGNNTISKTALDDSRNPLPSPDQGDNVVAVDLSSSGPFGLPDEDLFRLLPVFQPQASVVKGVVEPALRRAGTILHAHGRNHATGEYWIVGTDAKNTLATDEPSLQGIFTENRLAIASALDDGTAAHYSDVPVASVLKDLDDSRLPGSSAPDPVYSIDHSISIPTGLTFHNTGYGLITGVGSDRIRVATPMGDRLGEHEMPDGSMPRQIVFSSEGLIQFVYCWGTNEVRVYDANAVFSALLSSTNRVAPEGAGLIGTVSLGVDPTPNLVKQGREIFYDADRSLDGRSTCGHCHPGGGMDLLGWNIRDFPHDHKDLMVTQSLKSIEDTFPYHWRGERDLEAFNGAFRGILGGEPLQTADVMGESSEFETFKAFIFSLQAHANPNQIASRTLPESGSHLPFQHHLGFDPTQFPAGVPQVSKGSPKSGQGLMDFPNTLVGRFSCAECHGKTAGTIGGIQADDIPGTIAGNITMDTAHFRQLFHKQQPLVEIQFFDALTGQLELANVPRSGYGMSHDGNHASSLDFMKRNVFDFPPGIPTPREDLAAFIQMADEGIAPHAHTIYHIDADSTVQERDDIQADFLDQQGTEFEMDHWIDVALFGQHQDYLGVVHDLRWYFDRDLSQFVASDRTVVFSNGDVGVQGWRPLFSAAMAGEAEFTVVGLPPGSSFRWSVDRENDGLDDTDELATGGDPELPDTDGDGDLDGHEFNNNGNVASPATGSNDVDLPVIEYARIDHMGGSYAKLVLGFSEPVTYSVSAVGSETGEVIEYRLEPVLFDSVTVQRLVPSIPAMSMHSQGPLPTVSAISNQYRFTVTMLDLAQNSSVQTITVGDSTRDQVAPHPFDPSLKVTGQKIPPAVLSRTIASASWGSSTNGQTFDGQFTIAHRLTAPEVSDMYRDSAARPNNSLSPVDQQVIAFQVIHESATGQRSVLGPNGPGLHVATNPRFVDDIEIVPAILGAEVAIEGHFLLSDESNENGEATVQFALSQSLVAGEKVHLNVIGIYERDHPIASTPIYQFAISSIGSYSKPSTAPELRSLKFTQ